MRRFSIRTLMSAIVVSAIGLAALRNASDLWAGIMLLVALAAVGVAVLGAIILRGRDRCWWLGFALFGCGYLAMVFGPWESTVPRHLGTTNLLDYVHAKVVGSPIKNFDVTRYDKNSVLHQAIIPDRGVNITWPPDIVAATLPINRWSAALPGVANYDQFQRVGHSIFALIAGLVGGSIATWFYASASEPEQPPGKLDHDTVRYQRDRPLTASSGLLDEMRLAWVASQVGRHYLIKYGRSSGSSSALMASSGSPPRACIKSATQGPSLYWVRSIPRDANSASTSINRSRDGDSS